VPTYEYECLACKNRFEKVQKFSDAPEKECPQCGAAVRRVIFPAGVVFKGSGWYITDSRPSTEGTANGATVQADVKGGKLESKSDGKSDSKTDSGSESKSETKSKSDSSSTNGSAKSSTKSSSESSGSSSSKKSESAAAGSKS
jgi:putative FmdB family regulatory protein